jgi:DNA-binding Xre family transcriptional regulator
MPIIVCVNEMMRRRNMRHSTELHGELLKRGCEVSRQTVFRLTRSPKQNGYVSLALLSACCEIFECEVSDLIKFVPRPEAIPDKNEPPPYFRRRTIR